jgi:murein DD-endopeptidase MepM/ murein hydrolase activator NlpD
VSFLSIFAPADRRNLVLLVMVVFIGTVPSGAASAKRTTNSSLSWSVKGQPSRLVNGSPVIFRVTTPEPLKSLSGKWLEHDVFFSPDSKGKAWYGIAGISLETSPGAYSLELVGTTQTGKQLSFKKKYAVGKGKYHSTAASVPKQFTEPSAEQLHRIDEEKTLKGRVFAQVTPEREWAGNFRPPANAQISDVFGTSRTFNGHVQNVHQGLDYAVPEGTPVTALNSGTVVLAQPLFFEGGFVVLDHGQGLFTLYMHFSKIEAKEGEHVAKGQELGLSGGTGRATGPHLHIAVRWDGIYVNPATLLSLDIP